MTTRRKDEAEQADLITRDPYRHMPQQVPFKRDFAWGAFFFFAWVVIGSVAMILISHATPFNGRQNLFLLVAAAMLVGVLGAVLQLVRLGSYPKEERPVGFALAAWALPIGLFVAWIGAFMVHTAAYVPSYMGRRHRKGRKLLAPETEAGADWIVAEPTALALAIPGTERSALAAEWRDNG
ncbi:MAG: hypothetical protein QOI41_455, partial [Myxococcales bacterium]|nr:hypothetical protein [Myxococcales bacterium]